MPVEVGPAGSVLDPARDGRVFEDQRHRVPAALGGRSAGTRGRGEGTAVS